MFDLMPVHKTFFLRLPVLNVFIALFLFFFSVLLVFLAAVKSWVLIMRKA